MRPPRFALVCLTLFVFALGWNTLVHLVILADANTALQPLRRTDLPHRLAWSLLLTAGLIVFFVAGYTRWRRTSTLREGLGYGACFGVLAGLLVDANQYLLYPVPGTLAAAWFAAGLVEFSLYGLIAAWLQRSPAKNAPPVLTKPFITSNSDDLRVLFENFGLTFYYAQLLEDELRLILLAAELQGMLSFDRKKDLRIKHEDDDLVGACMGPLKDVIKAHRQPTDNDTLYDFLDVANDARRLIAHRFFVEHALDLLSNAGRSRTNQHLSKLYLTIRQAHTVSSEITVQLFSRMGFTREMLEQRRDALQRAVDDERNAKL